MLPNITILNENTKPLNDTRKEQVFCLIVHKITITAYTQAASLITCYGSGVMTIGTHLNVDEHWCSMMARGLMDIVPGELFHLYIANKAARLINLPKFMKLVYVSSTQTCLIHARNDDLHM